MRCLLVSRTELGILRRSSQGQGDSSGCAGRRLPGRCTGMAFVVSCRDGFHRQVGCGAAAARVHGGDPQAGGPAQIVGGSGAGGKVPATAWRGHPGWRTRHRCQGHLSALAAVMPGVGSNSGSARSVSIFAFPGEGFDGPIEPVPGWASDHGVFEGPPVECRVNRHLTSAGSRHRAALCGPGRPGSQGTSSWPPLVTGSGCRRSRRPRRRSVYWSAEMSCGLLFHGHSASALVTGQRVPEDLHLVSPPQTLSASSTLGTGAGWLLLPR
jgi:hypothetical protein